MGKNKSANPVWSRTHYIKKPEEREVLERRDTHCFIANDRRSGIACRRKEKQREIERKIALSKIIFYHN